MSGSTEQHDPDYLAFIQEKVAIARGELAADKGIPGAEVCRPSRYGRRKDKPG